MSKPLLRDRSAFNSVPPPGSWPWKATLWFLFIFFIVMTGIEFLISPDEINFDNGFAIVLGGFFRFFVGPLVYFWFLDLFILPLYRKSRSGNKDDPGGDS